MEYFAWLFGLFVVY